MQKSKKIYLLVLLIVISSILFVAGTSLSTASVTKNFSDVNEKDWFFSDVQYVRGKALMNGISETTFAPNDCTTRGMIVTILWRLDGDPQIVNKIPFSDVISEKYYYNAVGWASANRIVSGYNDTAFGPEDYITREQLAAILYRYASYKELNISSNKDINNFKDFEEISEYAVEAMKWANANGIITGITSETISPKGNATRCQVAAILKRMCENILNAKDDSPLEENQNTEKEDYTITNKPSADLSEDTSSSDNVPPSGAGDNSTTDDSNNIHEEIIVEQPAIKVNTAYGKPGEVIEVTLYLQKNPGILGMILSLEYDETAMRLLSVENGEAVSDVLTLTPSKTLDSGVRFVWDGLEVNSTDIKNGTLLTLKFEISDSVTIGKRYSLKFNYTPGDIVDTDLNEVNPRIYQGYIEIEEF
ncbi:MAG: S-layer homology domain-containing protein [Clostridiales bacterium]|nr:S-layer homology domain-containing protein [Clostridiales bacterium]